MWDRRQAGPATIIALAIGYAVLWFAARPASQPTISYLGQFFGAECVLLLSVGLVLISTLPWVEIWFDGIDRAAICRETQSKSSSSRTVPCFRHGLQVGLVHQTGLMCTPQLIAAARRLAGPRRISRVPFPWAGHGR